MSNRPPFPAARAGSDGRLVARAAEFCATLEMPLHADS